jgi:hypothetical protein
MSEFRLLGAPANWFVLSHFWGGIVGMAKHDAQPLIKISLCVICESECTIFCVVVTKKAAGRASSRAKERIGS